MKLIKTIILILLPFVGFSQAGATIYAGLVGGKSKDINITKENQLHLGYLAGVEARLNGGNMYFLLNGEYVKFDINSREDLEFLQKEDRLDMFKGRVGMGFNLFHLNKNVYVSSKLLGSFNLIMNYDASSIAAKEYQMNDGFLGAVTGLSITFSSIVVEWEYEKGFINQYFEKPLTTFDYMSLKLGFKF